MQIIGLEAEYPPPIRGIVVLHPEPTDNSLKPTVDSFRPTFRWKSFPRAEDYQAYGDKLLSRVSNVTYDLRIWRSWKCQVWISQPFAELNLGSAYSREGLPAAVHQLEVPLKPYAYYCWTVRAQFTINGHPRVTEWSRQMFPVFREEYEYGFQAPSGSEASE